MSIYHPFPSSMPVFERARLMVKRGECPDFSAAMKKLRQGRIDKARPVTPVTPTPTGAQPEPPRRLPYKDD